jgi:uncharacterized membrane protein
MERLDIAHLATCACIALWGPLATAASLTLLGPTGAASRMITAHAVSADGSVVAGTGTDPSRPWGEGARWTAVEGVTILAAYGDGWPVITATGLDVSADGSVVVGEGGWSNAWRWTAASGAQYIDGSVSSARGVSADGRVVVGYSGDSAFRWTPEGGLDPFGAIAMPGHVSSAFDVSADGNVIVGSIYPDDGLIAPAPFRWTPDAGMSDLGPLPEGTTGWATGVSGDGSVIVGVLLRPDGSRRTFRWTEATGVVDIGSASGVFPAVSADGRVIVSNAADTYSFLPPPAYFWTAGTGTRNLYQYLRQQEVDPADFIFDAVTAVSADGRYVVGYGRRGRDGETEAYLADLAAVPAPPAAALAVACIVAVTPVLRRRARRVGARPRHRPWRAAVDRQCTAALTAPASPMRCGRST